ncbi:hypothetical protein CUS_8006 [Ruminococcus albus 8]|uniref:Uncharacterized protein n=1 Tax=Ruminococcus albus 8 TaxID=246199 RepID=E9SAP4_RUMAL|nr:hypothetical protein CUS_8006 [Ruminococcus albus 8]
MTELCSHRLTAHFFCAKIPSDTEFFAMVCQSNIICLTPP